MKRLLLLLSVLLLVSVSYGQTATPNSYQASSLAVTGPYTPVYSGAISGWHQIVWTHTGTISTCAVQVDSSSDGITYTAGGVIASQNCATDGQSTVTAVNVNYLRVNLTVLTGGGSLQVKYKGWGINPAGGGGSGTVTSVSGTANQIIVTNPTTTPSLAFDPALILSSTQGIITTSAPFLSHTVTWNAGAVVFTDLSTSITCTAAATASVGAVFGVGAGDVALKYRAANCGNPSWVVPNGTLSSPGISFSVAGDGFFRSTVGNGGPVVDVNGTAVMAFSGGGSEAGPQLSPGSAFCWSNSTVPALSTTTDTCFWRPSAGLLQVGANTTGSTGSLKASGYQHGGTKFTTNGGCGETSGTTTGGATAGKFTTSGSTSCTTVITMGDTDTATNGWDCHAVDLTTAADSANPHQTATTTTTATIASGTIVSADVIQFSCVAY